LYSLPNNSQDLFVILQYILENNLTSTFPNVTIVLRILLILPVSVESGEKSFSKLKIIKNYLKSTMKERLFCLATLAIKHEILDEINIKILKKFIAVKRKSCSKMLFLQSLLV